MTTKQCGRGGRRKGAGRPRTDSKSFTFRVSKEMADVIECQENKTEFIKHCISNAVMQEERASDWMLHEDDVQGRFSHEDDVQGRFTQDETVLGRFGAVMPASKVGGLTLPFFDIGVVAGFPIPLDNDERAQDINILRMLCPYPESSYLIRVEGNSMIDAGIYSGDIVIVDKSKRNPSESDVAICELNGEYTVKRFVKRDGVGWLVPANPEYPEICVTENDDFSIWGTVTYIIHKPRE